MTVLDGDYNTVGRVGLKNSSSECLLNVDAAQRASIMGFGKYHYCLTDSLTLTKSTEPA